MLKRDDDITGKRVVALGLGVIGSYLIDHIGRMPDVAEVLLVDRDRCEKKNASCQAGVTPRDEGRMKADLQARRLRRINPKLKIEAFCGDVRALPVGRLLADVIVTSPDTRVARQYTSEWAWRIGVPLVDSGVNADSSLVRVNVYVPGPEAACLQCAWGDADYDALEQPYSCGVQYEESAPTNAPSALGALAAALQAIECTKLLAGDVEHSLAGRQVMMDAAGHRHWVTAFRRNPVCRFDHGIWPATERLGLKPSIATASDVLAVTEDRSRNGHRTLGVEGFLFATRLVCRKCGESEPTLYLERRLDPSDLACKCGGLRTPVGFESVRWLDPASVPKAALQRPLSEIGIASGDILAIRDGVGTVRYLV